MEINNIKNDSIIQAQKMLKQAANLPKQLSKKVRALQHKLLKVTIQDKISNSKIDTYA